MADHSVFVGDLDMSVGDLDLQQLFRSFFPSVRSAKVITDPQTGRSKGYGFVRFGNELERDRSLVDMNGQILASRPIRVSLATAKKTLMPIQGTLSASSAPHPSDYDPNNTTLFIGGLSAGLSEEELRAYFAPFGDIVYTKIPPGKGCGFVQFVNRANAEVAMQSMQGQVLGQTSIRISWGRSTSNARPAAAYGSQSGYSYGGSTYGASGSNFGASAYDTSSYGGSSGYGGANGHAASSAADPYAAYYAQIAAQDSSGYQALLAAYQQQQQQAGASQLLGQALPPQAATAPLQPLGGSLGGGAQGASSSLAAALKGLGYSQPDPRAPASVADLNRLLVDRQQGALLGGFRYKV